MKYVPGSWDLIIPSELLHLILSRLGLKDNIRASAVCKTWCEVAVPVRKLQPCPWLFYPTGSNYILADPLGSQTYKLNFPELKEHTFSYSRDGWLLVLKSISWALFLLNPFTRERINLPKVSSYYLAFSAAPTSSSCLVISLAQPNSNSSLVIDTWRPGETVWTTHRFDNQLPEHKWTQCVFSNGMFYWFSVCGYLGVFDPPRATWNILPVEPCPASYDAAFLKRMSMMEHEGDIFVVCIRRNRNLAVFKLNFKRKLWEEKRELGGLSVFASKPGSFARAGFSEKEKNRIYTSYPDDCGRYGRYYSLGDEKISSSSSYMPNFTAWVDPPHNNVNL